MGSAPGARGELTRALAACSKPLCLGLALIALWALMHHYQGQTRDGELYAMQAFARVVPALSGDLYLAHGSQDRFTLFSPLYSAVIVMIGLQPAGLLLFVICTAWFMAGAWALARALVGLDLAWLAASLVVCVPGYYGAYGIFHFSETYLTARSLSEALIVTALAVHFSGRPRLGLAVAAAALLAHPLMAFPGVLLLIALRVSIRMALLGSALSIAALAGVALLASSLQISSGILTVIDPAWLEIVRGRAQFLFLDEWRWSDWLTHAQAYLSLTLSALVLDDPRIRNLCVCAMLVGAVGLCVAFIGGATGPIALLLQGQAWRWFWITGFTSVLLLAPTAFRLWQQDGCGRLSAVLLIGAWTFAPMPVIPALALALMLWCVRGRIRPSTVRILRYAAYAVIAIALTWSVANALSLFTAPRTESSTESLLIDRIRSTFNLEIPAIASFWALWQWTGRRGAAASLFAAAALAAFLPRVVPSSLYRGDRMPGSPGQVAEFADWRSAIPSTSTVLMVPMAKAAGFMWFTLQRRSYLSVDQSAGVVFSRAAALEVRRRAQVLLPVSEPDWDIRSQLKREAQGQPEVTHPLDRQGLVSICSDPSLGFVLAREELGFAALRHTHAGAWKDWNLYDCRRIGIPGT